ncbi:MAG TPA: hypothetical protein VHB27_19525 [Rhodopila sp.]|uniref:hypothetical protein n=1 Tax=Rhodopila sp. TaxID=2480087 RepID=UPI002C4C2176|nr:hypothetical protein [Rhodopila sp.]HVY17422.1 hypothetical protein [Rhodopila sp.]
MADIVLAQIGSRTWMVDGEAFLDDLLGNMLPDHVTIEFITCESESEVKELWFANVADPAASGPPWLIHPAIVERTKRMVGMGGAFGVAFAPWSAARDASADATIAAAAEAALNNPDAPIVITSYVAEDAPGFSGDLANIRAGMVESELATRGVEASRITRSRTAPIGDQASKADLIEILISKD